MARTQSHTISQPVPGQVHRVPAQIINREMSLPVDCRLALSWIGRKRARLDVLWELQADRTARGLNAEAHLPSLLEAGRKDPELDAVIRTRFAVGSFRPEDRLTIPEPVIAHLTAVLDPSPPNLLWIIVGNDAIELLPDSIFERRLSASTFSLEDFAEPDPSLKGRY